MKKKETNYCIRFGRSLWSAGASGRAIFNIEDRETLSAKCRAWMMARRSARWNQSGPERRTSGVVGSSPRQERLASVSFGRNTDRLSKRHEATAKTNLKCLLTKQSELAALPAHGGETGAFAVYSSLWLLSCTSPRYH